MRHDIVDHVNTQINAMTSSVWECAKTIDARGIDTAVDVSIHADPVSGVYYVVAVVYSVDQLQDGKLEITVEPRL